MTPEILTIFFLLLLNAFFAMSEIAVVSASKPLLRQAAKQGNRRAAAALSLSESPGKFLSTVQVGITLVGILAGAYGGATIAEKLQPFFDDIAFLHPHGDAVAVAVVVGTITYFSVVMGELVPKQFALRHAEPIAMLVALPMTLLSRICAPVVVLLETSARALLWVLGQGGTTENLVTEAEVKAVLNEGAESGVIERDELSLLHRVIRLGDRDVKSIMTHRRDITFIDTADTPETIRTKVAAAKHSRYPVTDGSPDKIIGILHTKELLEQTLAGGTLSLGAVTRETVHIPDSTTCLEALDIFKKNDVHIAVIVDEYGSIEGVVTTSDLLEAIVGIIPSNYSEGDHMLITERLDGSWLVDGRTPIAEVQLTMEIDEITAGPNFETIAGFVLHNLSQQPTEGAAIEKFGYRFEVIDMDGRRIDKLLVSRIEDKNAAG